VKERPGFPVTDCGANRRAFKEQRKEGRGEEGETKEVTLATAFSEKHHHETGQGQVLTPVLDFQSGFGLVSRLFKITINT
jgi:hypothetical protein